MQSTEQAPGCVGSAKSRSTWGIPHGKCITCSCAHSSYSWSSDENPAEISKPLSSVNFAENSGRPKGPYDELRRALFSLITCIGIYGDIQAVF